MEELKKIEVEEAARTDVSRSEMPLIHPSSNIDEPSIPVIN